MSDETPSPVEVEIEGHKADLDGWISAVRDLSVGKSRENVVERFVRDCELLKTDMDKSDTPTAADLVDFTDRRNSLEIQFHHLKSNCR